MGTKITFNRWILIFFMFLAGCMIAACGGGGGGGDDGSPSSTPTLLSYTGSTAKAAVEADNAVEISTDAVNGGIRGTVFNGLSALTQPMQGTDAGRNGPLSTTMILQDAILALKNSPSAAPAPGMAVYTRQETIEGPCGGHADGNLRIDDQTGAFSGTLSFAAYCDTGVTIDGDTDFSGNIDLASEEITDLTIDFDHLEASDAYGSYVFEGTIDMAVQSPSTTITIDMYLQEGSGEDVFWLKNYRMHLVQQGSGLELTISGDFYHPDYGYVTLSTQEVLILDGYAMTPIAGVLIATGKIGSAGGPTRARLTCYGAGVFQVEADTDGDGGYDWVSDDLSWDDY